jgi:hypothetical protein
MSSFVTEIAQAAKNLCHPEGNIQIGALVVVGIETSVI